MVDRSKCFRLLPHFPGEACEVPEEGCDTHSSEDAVHDTPAHKAKTGSIKNRPVNRQVFPSFQGCCMSFDGKFVFLHLRAPQEGVLVDHVPSRHTCASMALLSRHDAFARPNPCVPLRTLGEV